MTRVFAAITTSVDGQMTGPNDGPEKRLGEGGERPTINIAPVILGGGKRLFEGFSTSLDLEHLGLRQSQYDVHRPPREEAPTVRCVDLGRRCSSHR
jgi:hypothetical protein